MAIINENKFLIVLMLLLFVCNQNTQAKNLGVHGNLYPIAEQDFLEFIQAKLDQLQQSGELEQMQMVWQEQARQKAIRPQPVEGLSVTTEERTWLIDPTITLSADLKDHMGNVIIPADQQFNPLDRVSLKEPIIFFNADDKTQRLWVKNELDTYQQKLKLILVQGNILEATNGFDQNIYFDQAGRLTQYFQIKHTPAIVIQKDKQLQVREVIP